MKNDSAKWVARTAMAVALLVLVQFLTKNLGQLVTGSAVNLVLALCALVFGTAVSAVAAIVSPFLAFLLGIGPKMLVLVPCIALGNLVYVLLISTLEKRFGGHSWSSYAAMAIAAAAKFATLYLVIVKLVGPAVLPEKALPTIAVTFGVTQLFTALIGGTLACLAAPALKKAVH
jgi:uncharacterized membrane protein